MADKDHAALQLMTLAFKTAQKSGHQLGDFSPIKAGANGSLTRTAGCPCGAQAEIRWRAGGIIGPTLAMPLQQCPLNATQDRASSDL
jgi:hypothetical protein